MTGLRASFFYWVGEEIFFCWKFRHAVTFVAHLEFLHRSGVQPAERPAPLSIKGTFKPPAHHCEMAPRGRGASVCREASASRTADFDGNCSRAFRVAKLEKVQQSGVVFLRLSVSRGNNSGRPLKPLGQCSIMMLRG